MESALKLEFGSSHEKFDVWPRPKAANDLKNYGDRGECYPSRPFAVGICGGNSSSPSIPVRQTFANNTSTLRAPSDFHQI